MYCPRCGAEVEEGVRYCASCGHELPQKKAATASAARRDQGSKGGLRRLVGEDRRTRLVTLATVAALVVAVIAFIVLKPSSDESAVPQDALTRELDALCVLHKQEIAQAENHALGGGGPSAVGRYAEAIVPIVGAWRSELSRTAIPHDRTELVDALKAALLEAQIQFGTLARATREANRGELGRAAAAEAAAQVDTATARVEAAIEELELQRCGGLRIAQGKLIRQ